ncbi:MAG TPA: FAD-dependent monooxygenase [Polyangia bacterium]|jgi:2-polyprenyl-6-methoxyphenol hydroxylase-like FAD-dependent oxidoreductase
MHNRDILISGASIAGPALALALRRHGYRPTIVERAPALRPGGYKVDIRGAAVRVLERMDLHDAVFSARTDMRGGSYVDDAGRAVVTLDGDLIGFRCDDDLEILRGELARILYERSRDEVEYSFGDSIAALAEDDDGVTVRFERGAPRRFALVVGADGLHSNVRALAFADAAAHERPLGGYIAIFSVANRWQLDRWELIHRAPGRIVNVYSTRGDERAKACFIFSSPPLAFDRRDVARQKALLAEAYAGVGWETPRLLAELPGADDFYFDSMTQIDLPRWSAGRVVLVGDAAYCPSPSSGQGTSLALVGAHVLAAELAAADGAHVAAFARYQSRMREFVAHNQTLGRDIVAQLANTGRGAMWLQTQAMRVMSRLPWRNWLLAPFMKKLRHAANAVAL